MESEASAKNPTVAKLKVAGALSGVLEVELEVWTVPMLREEVGKRLSCDPKLINLIWCGKVLKDREGNGKLSELGVKNNAKILVTRINAEQVSSLNKEMMAVEERSRRLARIKDAATALAKRHPDGSLPVDDFDIELEDQRGQKVHFVSETDRQALMVGLMLHANARHLIKIERYKDALDVLTMGEEAFLLCDPKVVEPIDNVSILQIDTAWCYFMLKDITWISMAGIRLAQARDGLERSRQRPVQQGCHPELALHMRLDLLEGVVAYHSGNFGKSRKALLSAQARYLQLQVPDEALSLLVSMGYKEHEATRAMRMNGQDVAKAVEFLVEEKEKNARRREEDNIRAKEIMEQKQYGMTPLKKAVDLQRLNELVSIGFERELAAEALRRNENDTQKALDDLTNAEKNSNLQIYIESRKRKRQRREENSAIEELVRMDFERSKVVAAVRKAGTLDKALQLLTSGSMLDNPSVVDDGNAAAAASASVPEVSNVDSALLSDEDAAEHSLETGLTEDRDEEMEDAIAKVLTGDPFEDYDIDITKEGEAITEYLALLASTQ